ncbi:WXG100 family type VII secretion target [Amycolatopsis aidingensis]|uniref:WXG100 family type VII secretion target n=1 Tax=Amycolatopsis aidingensis TaxID=2842453 RepID=UPI001C0E2D2B|nr:hypothetical protein [Amycolatopsis aidingensis]
MQPHGYPADQPPSPRCLPFPPPDWGESEEPEPDADDLGKPYDWMAVEHQELYRMVHDNVNLAGAEEVSQKWLDFGSDLHGISEGLRRIVSAFHAAWTGAAADQARQVFVNLMNWSHDTANQGWSLHRLVEEQAEHVKVAKETMPQPIRVMPLQPDRPLEPASADDGTTPMSASPFTSGGFGGATGLVADTGQQRQLFLDRHRQAAEVMEKLQRDSHGVYREVPEFTPPPPRIARVPDDPPKEPPRPDPERPQPEPDDGTEASNVGGGSTPPVGVGGPAPGGAPAPGASLPPNATPTAEQHGVGARAGTGAPGTGGTTAAAAGAGGGQRAGMGPMGMPMGAGGARSGGGEDSEHQRPSYLEEDSDFWSADVPVVPPVIGADRPGQREQ